MFVENMVRATLISNAGLLLEYRGVKLLVDAIYHTTDPFSNPPPAVWSEMLAGEPPFDGVDTLLFTHDHPDHFSPERLMQYLRYRTVRQVVLPVMEPQHWEILQPFLEERRIQWTLLTARMQTADFQIPGGTVIRPYFTRHIDKAFWNVPHSCYLISFGEKHVLLTADVDYTIETFGQISRVHMNAVFVNPLFFNALRTGTFFKGTLQPDLLCVYHIPFQEDDRWQIRSMLSHNLHRWNQEQGKVAVLSEPYQYVEF